MDAPFASAIATIILLSSVAVGMSVAAAAAGSEGVGLSCVDIAAGQQTGRFGIGGVGRRILRRDRRWRDRGGRGAGGGRRGGERRGGW